jgi:methyltransferase (TIGR00027 family)
VPNFRGRFLRDLHTSDRSSATAELVAVWRTIELRRPPSQRIVSDEYAPAFLTAGGRAMVAASRWGGPLLRLVQQQHLAGVWAFVLCRHRFIDEHLLAELAGGAQQVIVLGAGYDSRAYRFAAELDGRPVYEVDLPPLSRRKAAIVAARPEVFGHTSVRRVETDFRAQSLGTALIAAGFSALARTFVVWEGVVAYLDLEAVTSTLATVHELCGPGSVVALDLWDGASGPGVTAALRRFAARAFSFIGEPVTFGLSSTLAGAFLDMQGFSVFDLARAPELAARYSTDARPIEVSTYVLAARR